MSILVVCPGCHKQFKVSDQFAGKTGACPNPKCDAKISVPTKDKEVQVHTPTEFAEGGKSRSGKLITKPIAHRQAKFTPVAIAVVAGAILLVLAVAFLGGRAGLFDQSLPCIIGLLLISPPLTIATYILLHDDDLEPYQGKSLYIRAAICSAAYIGLWGIFGYVGDAEVLSGEMWEWLVVVPVFLVPGGLIALACFDLDFGDGLFHCGFYVLVTVLLRWVAGLQWVWNLTESAVS